MRLYSFRNVFYLNLNCFQANDVTSRSDRLDRTDGRISIALFRANLKLKTSVARYSDGSKAIWEDELPSDAWAPGFVY